MSLQSQALSGGHHTTLYDTAGLAECGGMLQLTFLPFCLANVVLASGGSGVLGMAAIIGSPMVELLDVDGSEAMVLCVVNVAFSVVFNGVVVGVNDVLNVFVDVDVGGGGVDVDLEEFE